MKKSLLSLGLLVGAMSLIAPAIQSAPPPGKGRPTGGETASSNISYPVILSENQAPGGFPLDGAWRFAEITDPGSQCVGEDNLLPAVDPNTVCYNGRKVTVVSETGEIVFSGEPKVWWLQKRTQNFWKALTVGHDTSTSLAVSAVDIGDLLESSPSIQTRQIRTEFNLLQSVPASDPELGAYVTNPCVVPDEPGESVGCLAALAMSGAVPGTEQSGNEIQVGCVRVC